MPSHYLNQYWLTVNWPIWTNVNHTASPYLHWSIQVCQGDNNQCCQGSPLMTYLFCVHQLNNRFNMCHLVSAHNSCPFTLTTGEAILLFLYFTYIWSHRMVTGFCFQSHYHQVSTIRRTKSQHLKYSRTVLWLSLPNPLKPDVKSRMKMQLDQRRQAMCQLHLSDRQNILPTKVCLILEVLCYFSLFDIPTLNTHFKFLLLHLKRK